MSAGQAWNNARRVLLVDVNNNALVTQPGNADDQPATDMGLVANARGFVYDGTAWDRAKGTNGNQQVLPVGTAGTALIAGDYADGIGNVGSALNAFARNVLFNGTSNDRQRGNVEGTLLASAARTANALSPTQTNHNARGVLVMVDVTLAGTGNLTPSICAIDPISGNTYVLLSGGPITASGRWGFLVYPGAPTVAFGASGTVQSVGHALPRTWYVSITSGDGSSWTYSIAFSTIV